MLGHFLRIMLTSFCGREKFLSPLWWEIGNSLVPILPAAANGGRVGFREVRFTGSGISKKVSLVSYPLDRSLRKWQFTAG